MGHQRLSIALIYLKPTGIISNVPKTENFGMKEIDIYENEIASITAPSHRQQDFLHVTCSAAVVSKLTSQAITDGESRRLKKLGNRSKEVYNWAGVTLNSADNDGASRKSQKSICTDQVVLKDQSINASMKHWKM